MHARADPVVVHARRQARAQAEPWPIPRPLASALAEVCPFDPDLLPETLRPWAVDLAERLQVPVDYPAAALTVMLAGLMLAGCSPQPNGAWQGYIEGEFVYVASPLAGALTNLAVSRGAEVKAGPDKPALTNLLTIFSLMSGQSPDEVTASYAGKGYADFKRDLAATVVEALAPFQGRLAELQADESFTLGVLKEGAERAESVALRTLARVRERVGLVPRPA